MDALLSQAHDFLGDGVAMSVPAIRHAIVAHSAAVRYAGRRDALTLELELHGVPRAPLLLQAEGAIVECHLL